MTVRHHPSDAWMLDFGTGNIGPAADLAIASHVAACPVCRKTNRLLGAVGGHFLSEGVGHPSPSDTFDRIMSRIADEPESTAGSATAAQHKTALPSPLGDVLGCDLDGVSWKRLGMGAYQYVIPLGDPAATARLLRIPAGRPVPVHTHRGTELTLVLCGSFSDSTGVYGPGDLQEADDSLVHQPHAAPGEDCVCLAVTEAPLRFKSWGARLLRPFLGI